MNIRRHFLVYKGLPKDVYFLFLSSVINRMGSFIMPLLTLILTVKVGFSKSEAGLISTLMIASQAPFLLLGGKLADKFGSKKVILVFDLAGALVYLVCAFLKPGFMVAVLIIVAADLYSIASPAYNTIVAKLTPPNQVKNAFSLMYLGFNLGLAVGPALGGLFFNSFLNLMFIVDGLTTIAAMALIFFKVRDRPTEEKDQETANAQNQTGNPEEATAPDSLVSFLYANSFLLIFSSILLIYNFCYIQWNFLLPLQMTDAYKAGGSSFFSLLVSMNAITVIVLTPALTSFTQKINPIRSIVLGGVCYCISFLMFASGSLRVIFLGGIVIMTVGEILLSINANSYIALRTPETYLSRANSLLFVVNGTGYALGPSLMGKILMHLSFRKAWILIFGVMLAASILMFFFKRIDYRAHDKESPLQKDADITLK